MAAPRPARVLPLCFLFLALCLIPAHAFQPRTLSQLPAGGVNTPQFPVNTSLLNNNLTALFRNFPANLTGNLTGLLLPNATELAKIQQYVLNYTRPSVASFIEGTNTTIDCVPIREQLSLVNASLANRTQIQLTPLLEPTLNATTFVTSAVPLLNSTIPRIAIPANFSTTLLNVTGLNAACPDGSVPVSRLTVADIARFGSLQAFLNSVLQKQAPPGLDAPPAPTVYNTSHEYASTSTTPNGFATISAPSAFFGVKTTFSVWAPYVEQPSGTREFSLSQIWITGGSGDDLQTIEAGWQVDPDAYGDREPHLFIYSTRKGYKDATCYAGRKDCPLGAGTFVQTSKTVFPNMRLPDTRSSGTTVLITILAYRGPSTGNWWIKLNGDWVGYYPGYLYTALGESADWVGLGGEIVNYARAKSAAPGLPHTKTDMGSGKFGTDADLSLNTVAFHYDMKYVDRNNHYQTLDGVQLVDDGVSAYNKQCYSGRLVSSTDGPQIFFYGGSGRNTMCPI